MNEFAKRIRSEKSQGLFKEVLPAVSETSAKIVEDFRKKFSDPKYPVPHTLSIRWFDSVQFDAYASIGNGVDIINIATSVPTALYKDGILLPLICADHFKEERYRELFVQLDYEGIPGAIMPSGLTKEQLKIKFYIVSLGWLYLHEQAHLFQKHGEVFASRMGTHISSKVVDWLEFSSSNEKAASGDAAWIKHCFELSADYEATNLMLQYLILDGKGTLQRSSLWVFTVALACMFKRFYGSARPEQKPYAEGTHPNPAFRMRAAYGVIVNNLLHPMVAKYVPWATTKNDIRLVMDHAFMVGNMYMEIAHGNAEFPQFMTRVIDDSPAALEYERGLAQWWKSLRSEISGMYGGWVEGSLMPDFDAKAA